MRRALTLIELLFALALLGVFMVAAASWTQIAGVSGSRISKAATFEAGTTAVFQLIHDNVASGDFNRADNLPRVSAVDGMLTIVTRALPAIDYDAGSVTHTFRLEQGSSELRLIESTEDRQSKTRLLLTEIRGFACEIDEELGQLTVTIEPVHGNPLSRTYKPR